MRKLLVHYRLRGSRLLHAPSWVLVRAHSAVILWIPQGNQGLNLSEIPQAAPVQFVGMEDLLAVAELLHRETLLGDSGVDQF